MNIDRNSIKAPRIIRIKNMEVALKRKLNQEMPSDTFEKTKENDEMTSNDNLQFKKVKVMFYPKDVERMKNMSLEERIEFKQQLKANNRYTILNIPQEEEQQ